MSARAGPGAPAVPRPSGAVRRWLRALRNVKQRTGIELDRWMASLAVGDISLFHEFAPPPAGGGHQFMRALASELRMRGLRVSINVIARETRACLFNSFNFDPARLRRHRRPGCHLVHRVDGFAALYRGFDDGTDERVVRLNREFASATVFQSAFSMNAHQERGLEFVRPVVIPNAADPAIFFPPVEPRRLDPNRPLRVVATSWSDNANKGGAIYRDFARRCGRDIEFTFIGRIGVPLPNTRVIAPLPSTALAAELRAHDAFLTASRNDSCSNAVIEAMTCGLPVVHLRSGGHPELVGQPSLAFDRAEELPAVMTRLRDHYQEYVAGVRAPEIAVVASRYLELLGFGEGS